MSKEYPRMMYADSGQVRTVGSQSEQEQASHDGFTTEPSAVHRAPTVASRSPVTPGDDALIEAIAQRTAELLFERMAVVEPVKRGPGRPPKPASENHEGDQP